MNIDTHSMISITEANQNFSKVTKLVEKEGSAIIMKNNTPKYIVIEFSKADALSPASDDDVIASSERFLKKNKAIYKELAK